MGNDIPEKSEAVIKNHGFSAPASFSGSGNDIMIQ